MPEEITKPRLLGISILMVLRRARHSLSQSNSSRSRNTDLRLKGKLSEARLVLKVLPELADGVIWSDNTHIAAHAAMLPTARCATTNVVRLYACVTSQP